MTYKPSLGPTLENDALQQYLYAELESIARAINGGEFQYIRLDVLNELPPRPADGDIAYFAQDVVSPGAQSEGLYSYEANQWKKLA